MTVKYEDYSRLCEIFRKSYLNHLYLSSGQLDENDIRLIYLSLVASKAQLKLGESEHLNKLEKEIGNAS